MSKKCPGSVCHACTSPDASKGMAAERQRLFAVALAVVGKAEAKSIGPWRPGTVPLTAIARCGWQFAAHGVDQSAMRGNH